MLHIFIYFNTVALSVITKRKGCLQIIMFKLSNFHTCLG